MHGGSVCNALIGTFRMHAFTGCTGCDTITAFASQGRRQPQPLECLTNDKAYKEAFTELKRSWEVSEELSEKKLQEFTHTTSSQINFHLVRTVSPSYHRAEMF